MNTRIENLVSGNSIWSRVFAYIKAYEDAQDTTPAERSIGRLDGQIAELSETLSVLEARLGY
ncbi:MAG: hypothetical protein JKX93_10280 [Rhizobiaceae bacterium]|nr:hypothetical protein [Rhizobiaceae bacterium]